MIINNSVIYKHAWRSWEETNNPRKNRTEIVGFSILKKYRTVLFFTHAKFNFTIIKSIPTPVKFNSMSGKFNSMSEKQTSPPPFHI